MWGLPLFDVTDPSTAMTGLVECRKAFPDHYIKVIGFDSRKGRQTTMLSFIVNRPDQSPGSFWSAQRARIAAYSTRFGPRVR